MGVNIRSRNPGRLILKILFICGGAFAGLDKVIANRVETGSGIGFGATVKAKSDKASEGELLAQVEPEDLIKFV